MATSSFRVGKWWAKDVLLACVRAAVPGAGVAIDLVDRLSARVEDAAAEKDAADRLEARLRAAVAEEVRTVLAALQRPRLPAAELEAEIRALRGIARQGWQPHLVEGIVAHSSHWASIHQSPQNYGRLLNDGEPLVADHIHLLVGLDRPRVLAMAPFALHALLSDQAAGLPPARVVGRSDLWAVSEQAAAAPADPERILERGASGPAVRALQEGLAAAGFPCGDDGRFGPEVQAAVRGFQRSRGLRVDGLVGPETKEALGQRPSAAPRPVAKRPADDPGQAVGEVRIGDTTVPLLRPSTVIHDRAMRPLARLIPVRHGVLVERVPGGPRVGWSGDPSPTWFDEAVPYVPADRAACVDDGGRPVEVRVELEPGAIEPGAEVQVTVLRRVFAALGGFEGEEARVRVQRELSRSGSRLPASFATDARYFWAGDVVRGVATRGLVIGAESFHAWAAGSLGGRYPLTRRFAEAEVRLDPSWTNFGGGLLGEFPTRTSGVHVAVALMLLGATVKIFR